MRQLEEVQVHKMSTYFVSQHLYVLEIGLTDAKVTAVNFGKGTCKKHACLPIPGLILMSEDRHVFV